MKNIIEVIKNSNFEYYGIRNENKNRREIGEILETSYIYDYDMDEPTEEEMGGVCTTGLYGIDTDNAEEIEEALIKALDINNSLYGLGGGVGNVYLVGSNNWNPYNAYEADEDEMILADAEVLAVIRLVN